MAKHLHKLLSISSEPISDSLHRPFEELEGIGHGQDLCWLLEQRNGFYAFESDLHVLPLRSDSATMGLDKWNAASTWRNLSDNIPQDCLFFAEDLFGNQFFLDDKGVFTFDAETGSLEEMAGDLEGWAGNILEDFEFLTGYPLAHQWQGQNGPLLPGQRLIPRIPFVCGGEFSIENLYPLDAVESMRFRADLARQIKDLPDGAQVKLKFS